MLTVLALVLGALALPRAAYSQSARASFFLQMLRQNPDARVRVSAALRLGELREPESVGPLLSVFDTEREPTVLAAVISTFATIGDPRALPAVQGALRHPSPAVAAQARRALSALQNAGGTTTSVGTTTGGPPRFLIGMGSVNSQAAAGANLQQAAQAAIQNALARRGEVVVQSGPAAAAQRLMRAQRLRGHFFDANIQSVQPRGAGVRAAVSIAVSTYPGRVYEFESSSAITITGGGSNSPELQQDAVRRAMESAVNRAIDQLAQGGQ